MAPNVNTSDLIGAAEAAEIIGLSQATSVTTYFRRYPDFPRPVVDLSKSRVRLWRRQDIVKWCDQRAVKS